MDPLSTFSLVSSIIQIVDFSAKAVNKCREIYKNGVASENEALEEMARHLTDLDRELELPDRNAKDEVSVLALKCSNTARMLVPELEKLKIDGQPRKFK